MVFIRSSDKWDRVIENSANLESGKWKTAKRKSEELGSGNWFSVNWRVTALMCTETFWDVSQNLLSLATQ